MNFHELVTEYCCLCFDRRFFFSGGSNTVIIIFPCMFSKHVSPLNTIKNKGAVFCSIDGVCMKLEARSTK
jgi:hypothetical protein